MKLTFCFSKVSLSTKTFWEKEKLILVWMFEIFQEFPEILTWLIKIKLKDERKYKLIIIMVDNILKNR